MFCKRFWKRAIPFVLAFSSTLFVINLFEKEEVIREVQEMKLKDEIVKVETGVGSAVCYPELSNRRFDFSFTKISPVSKSGSGNVKIISKPRAKYTDLARQNNVQGTVLLRVTFNSNGTIGTVSPVTTLSDGLTEQAIVAAKQMQFEPAKRKGQPVSVTKQVQYSFTIY